MSISSASFSKLLWPGLNSIWGDNYNRWPNEYLGLFTKETDSRRYVEDQLVSGLGLLSAKPEGAPIMYDTARQGFTQRYVHSVYASGFVITREMFDDDQYGVMGKKETLNLNEAAMQTTETVCANVYNRGFNPAYTFADGVEFFSTAHVNVAGGTFQNELTTAADLSEAAVEQACIDIGKWTDDRGLKAALKPVKLCVPVELRFEAERLLKTEYRVDTANNDISAIYHMGMFPQGWSENHYLTDPDAWFIRTDAKDGAKYFERDAYQFSQDNDFETENAKYKVRGRFSAGVTNVKTSFGSPGA